MSRTVPPVDGAVALTLFRALPNGDTRGYTATTFPKDPWQGCEQMVRMAAALGYIDSAGGDCYAVLDVLDCDGDIVQDYPIRSAAGFRFLKRKLGVVVASTDGDPDPTRRQKGGPA
ncbi:unannotated protein [freshwater metagenome]|uniref:Unannotated protein n=1 Tax=freshwater metagenome TaxID=449393 RepID=A0A6J7FKX6_9ZZZZ|nr:hypothetical protein [Actinomycetota bacterium]